MDVSGDWRARIGQRVSFKRILEMWMACHTQQEIAEATSTPQQTVGDLTKNFTEIGDLAESGKVAANHLTDFDIPIYNIWKFKEKSNEVAHFGNTEITIVDNLLYLYTQPFDVVVDPFAGGGTTALEEGEHFNERDEILVARGERATQANKGHTGKYEVTGEIISPVRTTASLAAEAGLSERSAQQRRQIARDVVADVKEAIRNTPVADSVTDLLKLARQTPAGTEATDGATERTRGKAASSGAPAS
jgi:hypothetical protein